MEKDFNKDKFYRINELNESKTDNYDNKIYVNFINKT